LQELPDGFGQLAQLRVLKLQRNQLMTLPLQFGDLARLTVVHLHRNMLRSLPESFGELMSLEEASLKYNRLASLPQSFGRLRALRNVDLHSNLLSTVPETWALLANLERVDLRSNLFTELPKVVDLLDFKLLHMLDLRCNPLVLSPDDHDRLALSCIARVSDGDQKQVSSPPVSPQSLPFDPGEALHDRAAMLENYLWGDLSHRVA